MPNTLLTASMITNMALMILRNELGFSRYVNREYDKSFGVAGAKIGYSLNLRKPVRYIAQEGAALVPQDMTETFVPLLLNHQIQVSIQATTADFYLSIDEFGPRFVQPAIAQMANKIDYYGTLQYVNVWNLVGTPGTPPSTSNTYTAAAALLSNNACPKDRRYNIISPDMEASIVPGLQGLYNPTAVIGKQYESGRMAKALGFDWDMDQNIATQQLANWGSSNSAAVFGSNQVGTSLITNGWAINTVVLNVGDVFTIPRCYQVNPQNYNLTPALQRFVVTAPVLSDGSGNATISFLPQIVLAGPQQSVNASPVSGQAIQPYNLPTSTANLAGTASTQGLAFHRDAFTLACADLPIPGGINMGHRAADKELQVSIRLIQQYDVHIDELITRMDALIGWLTMRPEIACRIAA